jgi:phospholipase/lecithinase/hemolysin
VEPWAGYVTAAQNVATATGAQVVNLGTTMPPVADDPSIYSDSVHPNDAGHLILAQTVAGVIS